MWTRTADGRSVDVPHDCVYVSLVLRDTRDAVWMVYDDRTGETTDRLLDLYEEFAAVDRPRAVCWPVNLSGWHYRCLWSDVLAIGLSCRKWSERPEAFGPVLRRLHP